MVAWPNRLRRNFHEGVRIQPDLAKQQIGIIAIKEDSNTAADSTAAKYLRRIGPGKGAHQVDATSERVKR